MSLSNSRRSRLRRHKTTNLKTTLASCRMQRFTLKMQVIYSAPKLWYISTRINDVTSQKTASHIFITVRNLNLALNLVWNKCHYQAFSLFLGLAVIDCFALIWSRFDSAVNLNSEPFRSWINKSTNQPLTLFHIILSEAWVTKSFRLRLYLAKAVF
jgi:hypothetical protein